MPQSPADRWALGEAYEPYIGRWSRLVAREFVAWLGVPPGGSWVDVGCGTGALTEAVLAGAAPLRVWAVDASPGFIVYARRSVPDWRVTFGIADARSLPAESEVADAVVSGLVLNFVPEPARAVMEMARIARRGAVVAAYLWDYADGMRLIRHFWDAAIALDPGAAPLDEAARFPLCHPERLDALWRDAGLVRAEGRAIEVRCRYASFEELWNPVLGGQGPAPSYLAALGDDARARLRDRFRAMLPIEADGSVTLAGRAWAVRGARA
jgi:SAM-dependent methyltransferase